MNEPETPDPDAWPVPEGYDPERPIYSTEGAWRCDCDAAYREGVALGAILTLLGAAALALAAWLLLC